MISQGAMRKWSGWLMKSGEIVTEKQLSNTDWAKEELFVAERLKRFWLMKPCLWILQRKRRPLPRPYVIRIEPWDPTTCFSCQTSHRNPSRRSVLFAFVTESRNSGGRTPEK